MKNLSLLATFIVAMVLIQCDSGQQPSVDTILLNQIGYPEGTAKLALIRADVDQFEIKSTSGTTVFTGSVGEPQYWELSGDQVAVADFSEFDDAGEYVLCINKNECSAPFEIGTELYNDLADAALKSYFYARAGVDIEEEFGGKWHYKSGHPDAEVFIHASAADENRPEESTISSPGGWYDAGDYGKYIVNSGISTWTILQSAAMNEDFHAAQHLNIPESGNELPDVVDEALVNLKWMMTMQDPNDGGVYHKLTTKNFDGFIMPAETSAPRYVVMKATPATLNFAATMAAASRILRDYDLEDLADKMTEQAEYAWKWAVEHPDVLYKQPEDVSTGAYGDGNASDEWFWAASELYLLTGKSIYKEKLVELYEKPNTPTWGGVHTLGIISLITSEKSDEFEPVKDDFLAYTDQLLEKEANAPYLVSLDHFAWGSNSDVANEGMLKLIAFQLTGEVKYFDSALNDLHYILGRNATGFSFVTGFGDKPPMHPHNRIIGADDIVDPIPGFIAGGPNTNVMTDCPADEVVRSEFPAASYTDTECSYSTNETAINWNAPLVFLTSGISAQK